MTKLQAGPVTYKSDGRPDDAGFFLQEDMHMHIFLLGSLRLQMLSSLSLMNTICGNRSQRLALGFAGVSRNFHHSEREM